MSSKHEWIFYIQLKTGKSCYIPSLRTMASIASFMFILPFWSWYGLLYAVMAYWLVSLTFSRSRKRPLTKRQLHKECFVHGKLSGRRKVDKYKGKTAALSGLWNCVMNLNSLYFTFWIKVWIDILTDWDAYVFFLMLFFQFLSVT